MVTETTDRHFDPLEEVEFEVEIVSCRFLSREAVSKATST